MLRPGSSPRALAGWATLAVFALLASAPAGAQVIERSDDELREQGWEFSDEVATPGTVPGGLLALSIGTIWHGAGHALAGDRKTANQLFAAEGVALGVAAAGLAIRQIGERSPGARDTGTTLQVLGGSLFAAGWFADVVGAFKGTAAPLPQNSDELPGVTAEAYVTTLAETGVGLNNIAVFRLPTVAERWALRPQAQVGLDVGYRRFGTRGGWRAPFGGTRGSFVELGGNIFDEHVTEYGYGRTQLAMGGALNLDVGDLLPHLGGLEWSNRVEIAVDHHYFESTGDRRFDGRNRLVHVPVEMGLGFNANQGVHIAMGYRHRRDELVGAAGRHVGMFWGRLGILPRNRVGVDLQVEQGAFTRAWFGLQWALTSGERLHSQSVAN